MNKECSANPFCTSLDSDTRELLCSNVTVTYQKPKQIQSNQWNKQLEIVAEGVLLKYTLLEDGSQKSIELVKPGGLLGQHLLFEDIEYPNYHTMALTEVKKCNYPIKLIKQLFDENKNFSLVLTQTLTKHMANNHTFWIEMHSRNSVEKVEYVYHLLEQSFVDMTLITQEDLALIAGVSRITVVRAMKEMYTSTHY